MSFDDSDEMQTKTGGRPASLGVIPGKYSLSVGKPISKPPQGWNWVSLSQVARLETGHTPSRKHPEYWGGEVPWIGIRDATGNHGSTIFDTQQRTNDLGIRNSSARILPTNTVCLSRTASVGYVVVMGRPMATSQDFVNWVCSDEIDFRFLKYILLSEHDTLLSFASGTTHQTIYFPEAKAFHVCLPSLEMQGAIADVLQSLDDRITLLRETNATLEAIAQALFKSWFVDFDPARAKMEGRAPEGMDEATARLFPDSFEESELGFVPGGWRVGQLGHEVKIAYGKNLPTSKLLASGYPVYGGNGQIGFSDKFLYESRQVLVACRGAASGKFNQSVPRSFVTNNSLVLESSDATPLLFGYLKGCISCADLIPFVTGSAQPQVTIDNLKNFKLLVPSDAAVRAFESFSAPIEDAIEANSQQAQTLATLRDTLLPRLISGQLRLPEAQAAAEEALA